LLVGHYRSHDLLFLGVGYSNFGLWDEVHQTADAVEDNAKRFIVQQPGLEHYLTTRVMMYTHFGKWKDVAALPPPQPLPDPHDPDAVGYCKKLTFKLATAMYYFGQTMVDAEAFPLASRYAAFGTADGRNVLLEAHDKKIVEDLFAFNQASSCVADADVGWGNNTAASILTVIHWRLLSRIALRQGAPQEAIENARQAVQMEDLLNYDEPPGWYVYSRETLGAALLLPGDAKAALAVFDKNLEDHPKNSRALFGRWQALLKLGSPDAGPAEKQFRLQWTGKELPELRNM
jgi:tetratricopeptide (TPR) repeat protein